MARTRLSFALLCVLAFCPAQADPLEGKRSYAEILEAAPPEAWRSVPADNLLIIELEDHTVMVELSGVLAQNHVVHIKKLVREGFYDGLSFYRVIDGFVAQGGDLREERTVQSGPRTVQAEFEEPIGKDVPFIPLGNPDGYAGEAGFIDGFPAGRENGIGWFAHCTGAMAMARDVDPDTGGTEFYITLQPQRYLDRNLTVFGRVLKGMTHLQKLTRVQPTETGETTGEGPPDIIRRMALASDLAADARPALQVFDTRHPLFAELVESRRNRPEAFFHYRPDYVALCAMPIPVQEAPEE